MWLQKKIRHGHERTYQIHRLTFSLLRVVLASVFLSLSSYEFGYGREQSGKQGYRRERQAAHGGAEAVRDHIVRLADPDAEFELDGLDERGEKDGREDGLDHRVGGEDRIPGAEGIEREGHGQTEGDEQEDVRDEGTVEFGFGLRINEGYEGNQTNVVTFLCSVDHRITVDENGDADKKEAVEP